MQELIIEKMTAEDLDTVYQIDEASFPIPWSKTSFEEELKNLLASYFVAKIAGQVVGYIGTWMVVDECHIMNVAVHPQFRRKGIAGKLVQHVLRYCNEHGISYILLEVRLHNFAAQNLYEKYGFRVDGVRKAYYKNPDGSYEDALLMIKEF